MTRRRGRHLGKLLVSVPMAAILPEERDGVHSDTPPILAVLSVDFASALSYLLDPSSRQLPLRAKRHGFCRLF
jgi:hypothetical protein